MWRKVRRELPNDIQRLIAAMCVVDSRETIVQESIMLSLLDDVVNGHVSVFEEEAACALNACKSYIAHSLRPKLWVRNLLLICRVLVENQYVGGPRSIQYTSTERACWSCLVASGVSIRQAQNLVYC